jgi:hypothetical protein
MATYFRAVEEHNAIKACVTENFHCAYFPYALNELNLALTQ